MARIVSADSSRRVFQCSGIRIFLTAKIRGLFCLTNGSKLAWNAHRSHEKFSIKLLLVANESILLMTIFVVVSQWDNWDDKIRKFSNTIKRDLLIWKLLNKTKEIEFAIWKIFQQKLQVFRSHTRISTNLRLTEFLISRNPIGAPVWNHQFCSNALRDCQLLQLARH